MASKRVITATAPDGAKVSVSVGAKRAVGAIRITGGFQVDENGQWLVTVHKTIEAAVTGPNQTPAWNKRARWSIVIDENDQAVGEWLPAHK